MLEDKQQNRQLLQKYRQLQKQLKQAHLQIKSLQEENQNLKERLSRYENQQSTYCLNSQGSEQEVFTSQSGSQSNQQEYIDFNQEAQQVVQAQNICVNDGSDSQIMVPVSVSRKMERTPTKVIFNYLSEGSQVPKLLAKQSKKQNIRSHTQAAQNNSNKWIALSIEHSAIKTQQPIMSKNLTNTIFQRVLRNSNKIFDGFFVTGYNFGSQCPVIDYAFPSMSKHIPAILSLIYTENSLRPLDNTPSSKSPRNFRPGKLSIKDSFVMILCKGQNGQKQYLFACEVDDILEGPDRNLYTFNRLFCFVSSCNFFSAFLKIIDQFIGKINNTKEDLRMLSPLYQYGTKDQLRDLLQQHLKFLFQKNVQENQTLNLRLDKQINIFIDVPSNVESYRTLLDYRPWGILFCPVYLPNQQELKQIKQKQLFGFLLVYLLTQTKIMLYSMIKSKVSQAIIHALEMIKPLQYVNPIIMATIKDQHQEYFNAPMSVIMGLWGDQRLKRKQKIEIFMNKKPSFCNISGILEENKMGNVDGVVFNLDTGYTFGGGLTPQKNKLAIQLNSLIQNTRNKTKQQYKIIQQLLQARTNYDNTQTKQLSQKLIKAIDGTQLYSFYKDKSSSLYKL